MENIQISSVEKAVDELVRFGDDESTLEVERQERICEFPHAVILEGAYPQHDFATRWCWQNVGACHGECDESSSEYPGCPFVLATERIENVGGRQEKKYTSVDAHVHDGPWTKYWLGKTDYDYGFGEYYFANEADRTRFIAAVATFSWGENYDA